MFIKSIRWRLQAWQAFLLVFILCGFGLTAYQLHRTNQLRLIDEQLERRAAALATDVRGPPPAAKGGPPRLPFEEREGPPPWLPGSEPREPRGPRSRMEDFLDSRPIRISGVTSNLFDAADPAGYFYAVWFRTGRLAKQSANAPRDLAFPARPGPEIRIHLVTRGEDRVAFLFTDLGECVLVGRPIARDLAALRRFAWWLVAAGSAVLALGIGGGWLLTTHSLRPVQQISDAASRIALGNLSERINVAEADSELGRLATVLNSTFARLETAFAQQRQFTADASHELRTPIAVIIAEAQSVLARERHAAEYRETVETCLEAAQQMRRLAQSLLELARYDAGQASLRCEPFDLSAPAAACLSLIRPLAGRRGLRLQADLPPTQAQGDADRMAQVVTNLLTNAMQHTPDGGEIRVAVREEGSLAVLTVSDTGSGIRPEDLPRVFERFYRGDKSRASREGRTGLGLAICKAIVDAHGGSIEVQSEVGQGTTVTVRIPR